MEEDQYEQACSASASVSVHSEGATQEDPALLALEALNRCPDGDQKGFDLMVQAAKAKMAEHAAKAKDGSSSSGPQSETEREETQKEEDESSLPLPEVPAELDSTLRVIAVNGVLPYSWHLIRTGICLKVVDVCLKSLDEQGWQPRQENNTFVIGVEQILSLLAKFSDAPFTVQRLAEVLLDGAKQYKQTHKLLNAIEKQLSVEMTLDEVDDGSGDVVLVQHQDEYYFPKRFQYVVGDGENAVDEDEEGKDPEETTRPNHSSSSNEGGNDENEENEEDKGSLKLKRKVGVSKESADPFTKRTRLQGDEIEQPEAFVASDYAV